MHWATTVATAAGYLVHKCDNAGPFLWWCARLCCVCFALGLGMRLQTQSRRRLGILLQSGAVWFRYGPLKQTDIP